MYTLHIRQFHLPFRYHTPAPSAGKFPTANSALINGAGRYSGGPATKLTSITVNRGKRYRFRLVSISCDPNYTFSIDGHNLTIIEVDGVSTEPLVVNEIQIYAGQRYSFILQANQPVGNYWIRSNPNLGTVGFDGGLNSAILRYRGSNATADPTTNQTTNIIPLVESNLVPLFNPAAPGTAESRRCRRPAQFEPRVQFYSTCFHNQWCHLCSAICSRSPANSQRHNGCDRPSSQWKCLHPSAQ
jgi:hypothetical protein